MESAGVQRQTQALALPFDCECLDGDTVREETGTRDKVHTGGKVPQFRLNYAPFAPTRDLLTTGGDRYDDCNPGPWPFSMQAEERGAAGSVLPCERGIMLQSTLVSWMTTTRCGFVFRKTSMIGRERFRELPPLTACGRLVTARRRDALDVHPAARVAASTQCLGGEPSNT
jgi:hypothetical protein